MVRNSPQHESQFFLRNGLAGAREACLRLQVNANRVGGFVKLGPPTQCTERDSMDHVIHAWRCAKREKVAMIQ
jgi:hypothetical protein